MTSITLTESIGHVDFVYDRETFKTWYKVVGNLNSGVSPVVILHGGPGMSHDYVLPHTDLTTRQIPVIFYDQIGNGQSTHLRGRPSSFWTVELFMAELQNLLNRLGVSDGYNLLGHSWGGILAISFALEYKPAGLKKLILTGTPASMKLYEKSVGKLVEGLPEELQQILHKHENNGTTDSEEYQKGMLVFYKKHVCTLDPWPQEILQSVTAMEEDPTVYHTMCGPSEFHVTGTLKPWSIIDKLHTTTYPVLLINSVYDEVQDICVLPFFHHIPHIKWVQFANSSHMPFWEERGRYFQIVGEFLQT